MQSSTRVVITGVVVLLAAGGASSQVKEYPLQGVDGLVLHNVAAAPATLQGKNGVRAVSYTHLTLPTILRV